MPLFRLSQPIPAVWLCDLLTLAVLLSVALALRWYLAHAALADLTGTEAAAGLMVRQILIGDRPLFLDPASLHGSLEAYLAAPVFALAGESLLSLRLIPVLGSLSFVVAVYVLARSNWNPRIARWSAFFAAAGPALLVVTGIRAGWGAIEMLSLGTWSLAWLALSLRRMKAQGLSFSGIGILAGLAIWSHPAGVVYLLTIVPPVLTRWGTRRAQDSVEQPTGPGRWGSLVEATFLLAGLAIGASPLIWSALVQPSFAARWLTGQSSFDPARLPETLTSLATVALPVAVGLLQPVGTSMPASDLLAESRVWQLGGLCLVAAIYLGTINYLLDRRGARFPAGWWLFTPLVIAPLWFLLRLPGPAAEPVDLLPIYSSLPLAVAAAVESPGYQRRFRRFLFFGTLAVLLLSLTLSLDSRASQPVASAATTPGSPREVIDFLDQHAIDAFYADSAIAWVVTFETGGRIAGAAIQGTDRLAWNPSPDIVTRVAASPAPAYIFARNSPDDRAFTGRLLREQVSAQRGETDRFAIYYAPSRLLTFS